MLSTTETMDLRDGKIPSGPLRKSLPNLAVAKPVDSRNVESRTTSEPATGSVRVQQREEGGLSLCSLDIFPLPSLPAFLCL